MKKKPTPSEATPLPLLIGQNIRRRRLAYGWTQQQLADRIGVDIASVSRYERGISTPTYEQLPAVLAVLELSAWQLFAPDQANDKFAALLAQKVQDLEPRQLDALMGIVDIFIASHSAK